jgi:FAD:protein FMN transferase
MKSRAFRAMNTDWWISSDRGDLAIAESLVREAEERLSRFRPDSSLSHLNLDRIVTDPWLAAVTSRGEAARQATNGAFDLRVADALVAAGYDRTFELVAAQPASRGLALNQPANDLHVEITGDTVRLVGTGMLDLGGIAKGWTVDQVGHLLGSAGAQYWIVDGGGDIRAAGTQERGTPWMVGVGDGLTVRLQDAAVCTSSTTRRRWRFGDGEAHHIINPTTGRSARGGATTAVVVAEDAATADTLATALVVDLDRGLQAAAGAGAGVLVETAGGWRMSASMERWLT